LIANPTRHASRRRAHRALWTLGLTLAALMTLPLGCASNSDTSTGGLAGIAVDNSGNILPGITVSLRSGAGKLVQTVLTGADGAYSFQDVPAGQYQVITTFQGFTAPTPLNATVLAGVMTQLPKLVLLPPDMHN
jgi:Carboxypeptidase regulatory-like domain